MDSFELNKIAGAVLFTILVILSLGIVADSIYGASEPEKAGYEIAVAEPETGPSTGTGTEAPVVEPIAVRLASADTTKGEASSKKCLACHTLGQGEPAKVGPNLYNVVGAPYGHMAGFAYSEAILKAKATGATWTFDNLDHFLANPKAFLPGSGAGDPGTKMTFVGIKNPVERANLIAYLRTLSPNPVPLPAPVAEAPAAAPADGGAPAASPDAPAAETPAPAPSEPEPAH